MRLLEARQRIGETRTRFATVKHPPVKPAPGGFPHRRASTLPFVSAGDMRELQRSALETFHFDVLQMTENAGRAAAALVLAMFGGKARSQRVVVLAGGGSMGASGLAAARHMAKWGFNVEPVIGEITDEMAPVARRQVEILRACGLYYGEQASSEETLREHLEHADLIVDSLVGYGLAGPPVGIAAAVAELATQSGRPVLSLDVPTGVDATTGQVYQPAIRATTTLLLDLPKRGILEESCRACVGELFLADVGVPALVYERAGIDLDGIFSEGPIVRIRR